MRTPKIAARPALVVILMTGIALASCGKKPPRPGGQDGSQVLHPAKGSPHQLMKRDLSDAERKYGLAPVPDPSVTYQPAVILVGGGPEAIRALSANGLTWTIDAGVPRAAELEPGKIFFMTGRAIGRVLDVRKEGANLLVTVGPVSLTDVIREAHIHSDAIPLDFGEALSYTSADLPGQFVPFAQIPAAGMSRPVNFSADSEWRFYKASASTPADAAPLPRRSYNAANFVVTPNVSTSGIGIGVAADDNGFKLAANATLHFLSPRLKVDIDITPFGGVQTAALVLTGAAGLNWDFKMGSEQTMSAGVKALLQPNTDFSIPLAAIGGIPLAVTIRQRFLIETGVEVKNSTLSATGGYTFTGEFKVGYLHKFWTADAPNQYTAETSMTKTGAGISLGLQGLTLADQVRIFVGLGAHGFATGPYLSLNSAIGAFRNSSIGMLACNGSTLNVTLNGGVGYVIPKSITDLINSVLRTLNIKYEITGEGGLEPGTPMTVIRKTSRIGGCGFDKDTDDKGSVKGGP